MIVTIKYWCFDIQPYFHQCQCMAEKIVLEWLIYALLFFQLEMEDEDTIDVFQQQTGGACS